MDELLALEKKVKKLIEEDTMRLLALGYTEEDLRLLDEALEYIAYPIVEEYFDVRPRIGGDGSLLPTNKSVI